MTLTPSSNGAIVNLFKSIDADGSGDIESADFIKMAGDDAEFGNEGWTKLESHFDVDGDGSITMDEFRFGLKGFGMKVALESEIGFEAPHYWTLTQWIAEIQAVFNKSARKSIYPLSNRSSAREHADRVRHRSFLGGISLFPSLCMLTRAVSMTSSHSEGCQRDLEALWVVPAVRRQEVRDAGKVQRCRASAGPNDDGRLPERGIHLAAEGALRFDGQG